MQKFHQNWFLKSRVLRTRDSVMQNVRGTSRDTSHISIESLPFAKLNWPEGCCAFKV